ncbi:MAG: trehalose-phosphatase [Pseudomonadota bacterium]
MTALPDLTARHAVFLDFDGTLVDIAPRPEAVVLQPRILRALAALKAALDGAVAIVSGRDMAVIDRYLAPLQLPVAGSHGSQRRSADGSVHRLAGERSALTDASAALQAFAAAHGLLVEEKEGSVSLHYRAKPVLEHAALALARRIARQDDRLRLVPGKMVAELALAGHDKGAALDAYLREPPFAGRTPLMAGDDTTDEDAFAAAIAAGGAAIKIGPGATRATHRAADIARFHAWLTGAALLRDMEAAR